ncbi:MAG: hypothetical protein AB1638_04370 [Nitrospirota bacterium]
MTIILEESYTESWARKRPEYNKASLLRNLEQLRENPDMVLEETIEEKE